jgi:hypothetical protein
MAAAKNRKEKKKLTLGRPTLVAGTYQTLSNLFWRLSISMVVVINSDITFILYDLIFPARLIHHIPRGNIFGKNA